MSKEARHILIVGAGPTGLTAALELARRGLAPRIIDRKSAPTPLSKAVGISARSLDILEASGVSARLLVRGIKVRHGHVRYKGRTLGMIDFSRIPHRFNFLLSLPQSETETVMCDVLAAMGITVEWRTTLITVRPGGDGVDVEIDGPRGREAARYDHVFGADGVHSRVRTETGLGFEGHVHSRLWSIADAEIADWPYEPDAAQLFLHEGGDVGFIIPIGVQRFRAVSNTPDAMARIGGDYRAHVLQVDTFHIPAQQAPTYQAGRVFLGGDAAHVHSPVGARGMNLGIEDAASFARRLAENDLEGYTAERRPVGRRWITLSERLLAAAQATRPAAVALRNLAFRIVGHMPSLQRPMLSRVAGLKE
jgi:2-polyprenyl-6-methoxyphenol hydroxylase-like FAD-dependent oxidoreductase